MRLAIIGLGSIGRRRLRLLCEMGQTVMGYDITSIQRSDGIAVAESPDELYAWKPEVIFICTPPKSHVHLALRALSVGIRGLFIEKPLSDSWNLAVKHLVAEAEAYDTVTMGAANWRFRAGVADLLAQPGPLVVRADVPIPKERRSNLLFDIGIHFLDLALWTGHEIRWALSYDAPYRIEMSCGAITLLWWDSSDGADDMYRAEMAHFLDCVEHGVPTCNPIDQAAETLRILLDCVERGAPTGNPISQAAAALRILLEAKI